ncbi:YoaK family protein [Lichenifustis flavocetrariae]|uniref:DUF1275 domain-containing protein n=1 Tax=Lichenifustis flavocetrariae TaxID=2949735 RepID=A0AA41Z074_9HYPH|nr:YoaK family protein [Lichenifustis flavocetrariae]MCW6511796.1 DUF1275 domain-containing protein [Lichenifustis flavocetrariae]
MTATASSFSASVGYRTLPALLSFIAGMVDVIGWLTLGGVFTAHITGNIVVFAAALAGGGQSHLTSILLIPIFGVSVLVADQLVHRSDRCAESHARSLLVIQFGLLVAAAVVAWALQPSRDPHGGAAFAVAAIAVMAMAAQNTFLHLSRKQAPTTAVMTGNIVAALVSGLALLRGDADRDEAARHWTATWPLLVGFVLGCIVGALLVGQSRTFAWIMPALFALGAVRLNERGPGLT